MSNPPSDCVNYDDPCAYAARRNYLSCLTWLRDNGYDWYYTTQEAAARYNAIECQEYATTNGCPWDAEVAEAAAENGNLARLQYVRNNGCPWDKRTVNAASYYGHLDCLEWALDNGCPRAYQAPINAIGGGWVKCLKRLDDGQANITETCSRIAKQKKRKKCQRYLKGHNKPGANDYSDVDDASADDKDDLNNNTDYDLTFWESVFNFQSFPFDDVDG